MFSYEGRNVRLRPLQLSDKERSIIWRNDPEIRDRALSYRFPVTDAMEDNWYTKMMTGDDSTKVYFSIENKDDNKHIGFIHLYDIDYISSTCYFGIIIGERDQHGKGKSVDAMHIMFRYAFNYLNLRKINLEVASFNHKAFRIYKKFGFVEEGVLRQQIFMCGNYYDKITMGLFKEEYYTHYPRKRHAVNGSEVKNVSKQDITELSKLL
jgi:UDP-4-amino-4,6-dideoxy-N-acetyl-beta-L-altrosamine N-acetyltransferase